MLDTIETKYSIQGFFGKYRPLSNFDMTSFTINEVLFKSAEHAFHYYKTCDELWQKKILNATTPGEAKKLGRRCPLRADWDKLKVGIIKNVLFSKFSQNAELKALLLSTGYKYLEETNDWNDVFWGVCKGIGENNLGKALMFVRAQLLVLKDELIC